MSEELRIDPQEWERIETCLARFESAVSELTSAVENFENSTENLGAHLAQDRRLRKKYS